MRRRLIRRAASLWLATLAVGALALLSALRWAPQLAPIAGGFVLVLAMLGLAALDFMLLRAEQRDDVDDSGIANAASAVLEDEIKRKDRGTLPQDLITETRSRQAPSAPPSDQRNA